MRKKKAIGINTNIVIPSPASTLNYTYVEFPMINILLVKTLRTYAISAACSRLENLAKACVKLKK